MKKLISLLLAFVLVLSFVGCGAQPEEAVEETEEALHATEETEVLTGAYKYDTEFVKTKPDYSHINEFEPNSDGVYQVHTKEGLLNMANHPDADFEILWDIDLEGAKWTPVGTKKNPFEGEITGGSGVASTFTVVTLTQGQTLTGQLCFQSLQLSVHSLFNLFFRNDIRIKIKK